MKARFLSLVFFVFLIHLAQAQPGTWSPRGIGGGGALFAPSINPANPDEYYVACDMTELFHTTDFGRSYEQLHFREFIGGHYSRVAFTNTPGILYSISYEDEIATPVRSTNNGQTWAPLAGTPDPFEDYYFIYADRTHSDRIIISDYSQIHYSSDNGLNFTTIHTAGSAAGAHVAGVFFDGDNIYVGTVDGVLVSTNAGTSWSMANISGLPTNERIASFTGGRSGSTVRFFCLTADQADVYAGVMGSDYWGFMQGVYTCKFGSSGWSSVMNGITNGVDFPTMVTMAENDVQTAYLGGGSSTSDPIILKTTDAGGTWNHVFLTSGNQNIATGWSGDGGDRGWGYGEMPFGMAVSPLDPDYIVFSDFGFVHGSTDGGTTWAQAYVDSLDQHPFNTPTPQGDEYRSIGLENTTCWQIHWIDSNQVWSCFSDIRGIRSTDGGDRWSFDYTGHTANSSYRIVQDAGGTLYMATSGIHDIYQSTYLQDSRLDNSDPNGKILYSTDQGASWQDLQVFGHPVFWIALDPNDPDRAYASVIHYDGGNGMGGVYRCNDLSSLASSTWTLLPDPPRTEKHPASLVVLNDGSLVATYSGRRNGSGAFTASSGVFLYDPSGNSWTDVSDPGMHYWTKDITPDPNDPTQNTWYVGVFSGWGGPPNGLGGLYKTTDRGSNWTKLTGSTIDRVSSCTFNPNDPDQLFFTTEGQGLWQSDDINAANPSINMVLSYPFRQPERVFFNPYDNAEMWVSSFGNGMKMGLVNVPVGLPEPEANFRVWPNPSTGDVYVDWPGEAGEKAVVFDLQGRKIAEMALQPGPNRLPLADGARGMYLIRVGDRSVKVWLER